MENLAYAIENTGSGDGIDVADSSMVQIVGNEVHTVGGLDFGSKVGDGIGKQKHWYVPVCDVYERIDSRTHVESITADLFNNEDVRVENNIIYDCIDQGMDIGKSILPCCQTAGIVGTRN